jgi:hypothetical protein
MKQGVDSDIHLCIILVGVGAQSSDILHGIACGSPCTEAGRSDVNSISSMVNGSNAAFEILGRRK